MLLSTLLCTSLSIQAAEPLELRVGFDLRAVSSDSKDSFLYGGLDRNRFDRNHEGLRLGDAYVSARYRLTDTLTLHGDAISFGDGSGPAVDVTQLYLKFRPYPDGPIRWSSRVGMFYPEFSMENRGSAWTPIYTITPSAINSWYGEELRTLGVETEARWLGGNVGYQGDVALVMGAYGWNDPFGAEVAERGWALHDRQTGLTSHLVQPGDPGTKIYEFREIDGRPGFYTGIDWHHGDRLNVRVYHYDNRADPAAFDHVYAWLTRFNTVGLRYEVNANWTVVTQALRGDTFVGPQNTWGAAWNMNAWFVLLSREWHAWRISLRRDQFNTEQYRGFGQPHEYDDRGDAWTLAASWDWRANWQFAVEWLQVNSSFEPRSDLGDTVAQHEHQLQLAVRYHWRQ